MLCKTKQTQAKKTKVRFGKPRRPRLEKTELMVKRRQKNYGEKAEVMVQNLCGTNF